MVLFVNVTEKTLALFRQKTYNHLIKLPVTFFEKHRVGELNSRISSDISLLQETTDIYPGGIYKTDYNNYGRYYLAYDNFLETDSVYAFRYSRE